MVAQVRLESNQSAPVEHRAFSRVQDDVYRPIAKPVFKKRGLWHEFAFHCSERSNKWLNEDEMGANAIPMGVPRNIKAIWTATGQLCREGTQDAK